MNTHLAVMPSIFQRKKSASGAEHLALPGAPGAASDEPPGPRPQHHHEVGTWAEAGGASAGAHAGGPQLAATADWERRQSAESVLLRLRAQYEERDGHDSQLAAGAGAARLPVAGGGYNQEHVEECDAEYDDDDRYSGPEYADEDEGAYEDVEPVAEPVLEHDDDSDGECGPGSGATPTTATDGKIFEFPAVLYDLDAPQSAAHSATAASPPQASLDDDHDHDHDGEYRDNGEDEYVDEHSVDDADDFGAAAFGDDQYYRRLTAAAYNLGEEYSPGSQAGYTIDSYDYRPARRPPHPPVSGPPRVAALAPEFATHRQQQKHESLSRNTVLAQSPAWKPGGRAIGSVRKGLARHTPEPNANKPRAIPRGDGQVWSVAVKAAESAARRRHRQASSAARERAVSRPAARGFGSSAVRMSGGAVPVAASAAHGTPPRAAAAEDKWLRRRRQLAKTSANRPRENLAFGSSIPTMRNDSIPEQYHHVEVSAESWLEGTADGFSSAHPAAGGEQQYDAQSVSAPMASPMAGQKLDAAAIRLALEKSRARNVELARGLQDRLSNISGPEDGGDKSGVRELVDALAPTVEALKAPLVAQRPRPRPRSPVARSTVLRDKPSTLSKRIATLQPGGIWKRTATQRIGKEEWVLLETEDGLSGWTLSSATGMGHSPIVTAPAMTRIPAAPTTGDMGSRGSASASASAAPIGGKIPVPILVSGPTEELPMQARFLGPDLLEGLEKMAPEMNGGEIGFFTPSKNRPPLHGTESTADSGDGQSGAAGVLAGVLRVKLVQAREIGQAGYFERHDEDDPGTICCAVGQQRQELTKTKPATLQVLTGVFVMKVELVTQSGMVHSTTVDLHSVIKTGHNDSWHDLCETSDGANSKSRAMLQLDLAFAEVACDVAPVQPTVSPLLSAGPGRGSAGGPAVTNARHGESSDPPFAGCDEAVATLARYCEEERPPSSLLLTGPHGVGTSRLLREFAEQFQHDKQRQGTTALVLFHQICPSAFDAWSVRKLLLALCAQLIRNYPALLPVSLHGGVPQLTETWISLSERAASLAGCPVVFVIDGVEHLRGSSAWLLSKVLPVALRVILAINNESSTYALLSASDSVAEVQLDPLGAEQRRVLVAHMLHSHQVADALYSDQLVDMLVSREQAGIPLYLVAACKVLAELASTLTSREGMERFVARELPGTISGVFRFVLNSAEQKDWRDGGGDGGSGLSRVEMVERSLSFLALASTRAGGGGGGLTRLQIQALLQPLAPPLGDLKSFFQSLGCFISDAPSADGGILYFPNESEAAEVLTRYQLQADTTTRSFHHELGAQFSASVGLASAALPLPGADMKTFRQRRAETERLAERVVYHFIVSEDWALLRRFMQDFGAKFSALPACLTATLAELEVTAEATADDPVFVELLASFGKRLVL